MTLPPSQFPTTFAMARESRTASGAWEWSGDSDRLHGRK